MHQLFLSGNMFKQKDTSPEGELSSALKEASSSSNRNTVVRGLNKVVDLLGKDPRYVEVCLQRPDFLKTEFRVEDRSTTLMHRLAESIPEQSLAVFELMKSRPSEYLPILEKRDSENYMAGALLIMHAIEKDERSSSVMDLARMEVGAIKLGPSIVGLAIAVPKHTTPGPLGMKVIDALKEHPQLESILKMSGPKNISVAHDFAVESRMAPALIDLISGKPFFADILELKVGTDGTKLWMGLSKNCDAVNRIVDGLEKIPIEVTKRLLGSKMESSDEEMSMHFVHVLLAHKHAFPRVRKLIENNAGMEELLALELKFHGRAVISTKELMEKVSEMN